jgi:hypothetical protein
MIDEVTLRGRLARMRALEPHRHCTDFEMIERAAKRMYFFSVVGGLAVGSGLATVAISFSVREAVTTVLMIPFFIFILVEHARLESAKSFLAKRGVQNLDRLPDGSAEQSDGANAALCAPRSSS